MRLAPIWAVTALAAITLPASLLAGDDKDVGQDQFSLSEVLDDVPLIDGHNDLIIHFIDFETGEFKSAESYEIRGTTTGQSDLARMRKGNLGAAIFTIATSDDNSPEAGLEASVTLFADLVRNSPNDLAIVTTPDELLAAHGEGKIGIILGLEGGNPVEGDITRLAWMRERGVAEMGLVWSTNGLGTAGRESDSPEGLTELGLQVVEEMNKLGMIVDVSHASPATVLDVVAVSKAPVIDSHAYASRFSVSGSTATDRAHQAIAEHGGIVMPMFMPDPIDPQYGEWMKRRNAEFTQVAIRILGESEGKNATHFLPWPEAVAIEMEKWISANPPPATGIERIADVYDHVRTIVGIDHIGIGSDFDGMGFHPSGWHPALRDVSQLPDLFAILHARGWSDEDLRKLAGENFLRVWREIISAAHSD